VTALERVLAEEWPDGAFGGPRPRTVAYSPAEAQEQRLEAIARRQADLRAELLTDLRNRKAAQPIPRRPRKATR
jgi:hypothetical protein